MRNPLDLFRKFLPIRAQSGFRQRRRGRLAGNPVASERAKDTKDCRLGPRACLIIGTLLHATIISSIAVAQSEPANPESKETEATKPDVVQLPTGQFNPQEFIQPFVDAPAQASPVLRFQSTNALKAGNHVSAMSFARDGSRKPPATLAQTYQIRKSIFMTRHHVESLAVCLVNPVPLTQSRSHLSATVSRPPMRMGISHMQHQLQQASCVLHSDVELWAGKSRELINELTRQLTVNREPTFVTNGPDRPTRESVNPYAPPVS
jgi:hypothetical protein